MNAPRLLVCLFASCLIAPGSARSQDADKEISNSIGMKLVLIPAGKFTMGSPRKVIDYLIDRYQDLARYINAEGPEHEVEITRPFYMGATEVTVGLLVWHV